MRTTRSLRAFAPLLAAAFAVVGLSSPAQADDPYAYWLYFSVEDGEFSFQDVGPAQYKPKDGDVEAYRYASALFPPTQEPRADLTEVSFDAVCGDAEAGEGEKRVAVLIDYGIDGDAPSGDADAPDPVAECAVVPAKATGIQTLQAVAEVRSEDGGVCGIDGYPSSGDCFALAEEVSADDAGPVEFTVAADGEDVGGSGDDDSNWPLLVGVGGVVLLIGAGGVVMARRNRAAA
jgi:LPXTG-motif cell wall-anchored protein